MPKTHNYDYSATINDGTTSYSTTIHRRKFKKCDVELWKDAYGFWCGRFIFDDGSEERLEEEEAENLVTFYRLDDDSEYDQMYEKFQSKVPMRW